MPKPRLSAWEPHRDLALVGALDVPTSVQVLSLVVGQVDVGSLDGCGGGLAAFHFVSRGSRFIGPRRMSSDVDLAA